MERKTLAAFFAISLLVGCSAKKEETTKPEEPVNTEETTIVTEEPTPTPKETVNENIVKSGEVKYVLTGELCEREIVSYDLGFNQHSLTKGEEVLCVKFRVKNLSDTIIDIGTLLNSTLYIDGVEADPYISDFYGDGEAYKNMWETNVRSGSEAYIYFCYHCSVNDSHEIAVDFGEECHYDDSYGKYVISYNSPIVDTVEFSIE